MSLRIAIAFLSVSIPVCCTATNRGAPARLVTPEACDFAAEGEAYLSSAARQDAVYASVRGPSCGEATFLLQVRTLDGEVIYRHSQPFLALLPPSATQRKEADLAAAAALLVNRAATENPLRRASSLPEYRAGPFEYESSGAAVMAEVLVSRDVYSRIRESDRPVFEHIIGWETGRYIAIDPATNRAVAILASWL
jgi:hypothetical protein